MDERRSVRPPNWDELAYRFAIVTDGAVTIKGEMLRKWLPIGSTRPLVNISSKSRRAAVANVGLCTLGAMFAWVRRVIAEGACLCTPIYLGAPDGRQSADVGAVIPYVRSIR